MPFDCSISLSNIDILCQKIGGGLKKIMLFERGDISITFSDELSKEVSSITALNPSQISYVLNDGITSFNETSGNSSGLVTFDTNIEIEVPSISYNLNKIDDMGLRPDIVAICHHSNDTVSVTGYDNSDLVSLNYDSNSGSGISDKSYIRITLAYSTKYGSIYMNDYSLFTNPAIFN